MTMTAILRSLARRWYVLLLGIVATAIMSALAFASSQPVYERSASELLVPGARTVPEGGNPFLYLGGLSQASDVLVRALSADDLQGPIHAEYPKVAVRIGRDVSTSGPLIVFNVQGENEEAVRGALQRMIEAGSTVLSSLQIDEDVAPAARITIVPITVDAKSTISVKGRTQLTSLVAAGGIVLTLLAVGLVDGLILARARRRTGFGDRRTSPVATKILPSSGRMTSRGIRVASRQTRGTGRHDSR